MKRLLVRIAIVLLVVLLCQGKASGAGSEFLPGAEATGKWAVGPVLQSGGNTNGFGFDLQTPLLWTAVLLRGGGGYVYAGPGWGTSRVFTQARVGAVFLIPKMIETRFSPRFSVSIVRSFEGSRIEIERDGSVGIEATLGLQSLLSEVEVADGRRHEIGLLFEVGLGETRLRDQHENGRFESIAGFLARIGLHTFF